MPVHASLTSTDQLSNLLGHTYEKLTRSAVPERARRLRWRDVARPFASSAATARKERRKLAEPPLSLPSRSNPQFTYLEMARWFTGLRALQAHASDAARAEVFHFEVVLEAMAGTLRQRERQLHSR